MEQLSRYLVIFVFGLLAWSVTLVWAEPGNSLPSPFHFETVSDRSLALREGDRRVWIYHFGFISDTNAPAAQSRSGYIHPLYGLDGEVLTDDFPKDHDYHRGLYWAWPHIEVAGHEYDLWSLRGIRSEFRHWRTRETQPQLAVLEVENAWVAGNHDVMRETVRIETHLRTADSQAIDLVLTFAPTDQPVTLWGAPEKSYGGLTLRFAPRSRTIITVPTGRADEDLLMARLPWADLSGDLNGVDRPLSGVAIFVPPKHPGYPPEWMTRHYGVLAVGWPGVTRQTITEPVTLRYRIWIHRNFVRSEELQNAWQAYSTSAMAEVKK